MTLTPAFGRDYKSKKEILESLNKGEDFILNAYNGHGYCSVRDLPNGYVQVRNANHQKVWSVTVQNGIAK